MNDSLPNGKTILSFFRNAPLIHGQSENAGAIFSGNGQYPLHRALFPIDRVNNWLSIILPQHRLDNFRVRGVNLYRQIDQIADSLDSPQHHFLFINIRQTKIDVKNVSPFFFLFDSQLFNKGKLSAAQLFF